MKIEKLRIKLKDFANQRIDLQIELTKAVMKTKGDEPQIKQLLEEANKVGIKVTNKSLALVVMKKNNTLSDSKSIPKGMFVCTVCGKIRTRYSTSQKVCTYCK